MTDNIEDVSLRSKESQGPQEMTDGRRPMSVEEIIKELQRLSSADQQTVQNHLEHLSLFDHGTVKINARSGDDKAPNLQWKHLAPEAVNTFRKVDRGKRDEQIEAVLEGIEFIRERKLPRGLILDSDNEMKGPVSVKHVTEGCGKMAEILGRGNSAGDITVFKDTNSGQEMALKTIMISQFNANEIRLWVHLADLDMAPQLYSFELLDNKLYFTMEIMSGKDLQDVIDEDMWSFRDPLLARDFSLCILHDMLKTWEEMRSKKFVHADMHAGNLRLERSMDVKIFDFGRARQLLGATDETKTSLIKDDIVGIIRVFCALYSGYDFNNVFEAKKVLEAQNLKELDDNMIRLTEDTRKELYHIMTMLFDTVRDTKKSLESTNNSNSSFGDTGEVVQHLDVLLSSKDIADIKRRAAVIIFPERFQNKAECEPIHIDSVDGGGGPLDSNRDLIWDDPNMEEYVSYVTDEDVKELGAFWRSNVEESGW